jgi:hypothetical protein
MSPPHPELAKVRTLTALVDHKGRSVEKGAQGWIVDVHGHAYTVEVSIVDDSGIALDSHLLEASHDEIELWKDRVLGTGDDLPDFAAATDRMRELLVSHEHPSTFVWVFREDICWITPATILLRPLTQRDTADLSRRIYEEGRAKGIVEIRALARTRDAVAVTVWYPAQLINQVQGWNRGLKLSVSEPLPRARSIPAIAWFGVRHSPWYRRGQVRRSWVLTRKWATAGWRESPTAGGPADSLIAKIRIVGGDSQAAGVALDEELSIGSRVLTLDAREWPDLSSVQAILPAVAGESVSETGQVPWILRTRMAAACAGQSLVVIRNAESCSRALLGKVVDLIYRVMADEDAASPRKVLLVGWSQPRLKSFWPCYRLVEYAVEVSKPTATD